MPALFTSTSMRGSASILALTWPASVTSQTSVLASPPWSAIAARVASSVACVRPTRTTAAPASASASAAPWPSPLPAPVTTACMPSRRNECIALAMQKPPACDQDLPDLYGRQHAGQRKGARHGRLSETRAGARGDPRRRRAGERDRARHPGRPRGARRCRRCATYSEKFDRWSPPSFRLSQAEIDALVASVPQRTIDDITFAQAQIRHFAKAQKDALKDIEVTTLPGVTLGHKSIPVASVGCYVPGGRYPMVASAHMSIVTAKVAGVRRIVACTPPTDGAAHAETIAAMALGGADEIFLAGRRPGGRRDGARHRDDRAGRHAGRARQRLCRRGQAPAVRPGRHRPPRRPDRDPGDRRRQRGRGDGRDRPAGPGRARADLARHADHHEPGAGRGAAGRDRAPARRAADRRGRARAPGATTARSCWSRTWTRRSPRPTRRPSSMSRC